MNIKKIGHCCLLIEYKDKRILTDPGGFTVDDHVVLDNLDFIVVTHDHGDHLHAESMQTLVQNNPQVQIITNSEVGAQLSGKGIDFTQIEDGQEITINDILFEGFGTEHAEIFEDFGSTLNTGYFIDNKMFYPGDAFTNPGKTVEVLAVPVAAPWMAIREAIRYVNEIKPQYCFPVHDHVLSTDGRAIAFKVFQANIDDNVKFQALDKGDQFKF